MKKKLIVFSLIVLMILATFSFSGCNAMRQWQFQRELAYIATYFDLSDPQILWGGGFEPVCFDDPDNEVGIFIVFKVMVAAPIPLELRHLGLDNVREYSFTLYPPHTPFPTERFNPGARLFLTSPSPESIGYAIRQIETLVFVSGAGPTRRYLV